MLDYLFKASPILIALVVYFIRLERKLATIITDIDWIKTFIIDNSNPDHKSHRTDLRNDLPR